MKSQVKNEKEIIKTAANVVAEKFGIDQKELKLSFRQRNGIFYTFQFTAKERAYLDAHKTSFYVTMNVAGIPIDLYKN